MPMEVFDRAKAAELLAARKKPKPSKEAAAKLLRQRSKAHNQATAALRDLHPEEYQTLYDVALAEIQTEDGEPEVAV